MLWKAPFRSSIRMLVSLCPLPFILFRHLRPVVKTKRLTNRNSTEIFLNDLLRTFNARSVTCTFLLSDSASATKEFTRNKKRRWPILSSMERRWKSLKRMAPIWCLVKKYGFLIEFSVV